MQCYISTYGLYNAGFLSGRWFDHTELDDPDAILAEIQALAAKDGANPDDVGDEFMIQDSEGFPHDVSERSSLAELAEIAKDCENDRYLLERVKLVRKVHCLHDLSWSDIKDLCYEVVIVQGDTIEDAAAYWAEESGMFRYASEMLKRYFDFSAYARDLLSDGWVAVRTGGTVYLVYTP